MLKQFYPKHTQQQGKRGGSLQFNDNLLSLKAQKMEILPFTPSRKLFLEQQPLFVKAKTNNDAVNSKIQQKSLDDISTSSSSCSTSRKDTEENELNKPDVIHLELKGFEFKKQIQEIAKVIEQKQVKINLVVDISFQYQYAMTAFEKYIAIIAPSVAYLKWSVKNQFAIGKQSSFVKDILQLFTNLYQLEITFATNYSFTKKNIQYIMEGMSTLKVLKILHFNLQEVTDQNISLFQTLDDTINSSLISLDFLEVFESNILIVDADSVIFPSLSNIQVFLTEKLTKSIQIQNQLADEKRGKITQISFNEDLIDYFNSFSTQTDIDLLQVFFNKCIDLPYLSFVQMIPSVFTHNKLQKSANIVKQLSSDRYSSILQYIAFTNLIEQFQTIHPKLIFMDLWIN